MKNNKKKIAVSHFVFLALAKNEPRGITYSIFYSKVREKGNSLQSPVICFLKLWSNFAHSQMLAFFPEYSLRSMTLEPSLGKGSSE